MLFMTVFELEVLHEWQYSKKKKISGGLSELQSLLFMLRGWAPYRTTYCFSPLNRSPCLPQLPPLLPRTKLISSCNKSGCLIK